ncbi:MAG: glutathione S-transferase family protein [Hyphomonadaceae bacterium]|nr:glutathione S-transferase family protein [Hyphomonadaceae bacterium]
MTAFVLYAAPGTCARVPMIALEEAEQDFEVRVVRFMKGEHRSPAYLALNPKGKVPLLVADGEPLSENVAILLYLGDRFPGLLPRTQNERERLRIVEDLCFHSATLHPIVTRIRMSGFFVDGAEAQKSLHAKAVEAMRPNTALVEARLKGGRWWYGETWSCLDAYFFWVWFRVTGAGFPAQHYPACADHARRMAQRPAVQRALAREAEMERQLESEGLAFRPPDPPAKVE